MPFLNGWWSSRLAHPNYFSTFLEYVFKHMLDKEEWNKPFENIHLYQQKEVTPVDKENLEKDHPASLNLE